MLDIPTLVVTAAVSAIVGTFFAVITTSRLTVLRVRAERREAALEAVRAIVRPWRRLVLRFNDGFAPTAQRDCVRHPSDALEAARVLRAAEVLSFPRRWLVRRRCARVFGREYTWLASRHIGEDQEQALTSTTVLSLNLLKRGREGRPITSGDGLLQRGLMTKPGSRTLRKLARELSLLSHLI